MYYFLVAKKTQHNLNAQPFTVAGLHTDWHHSNKAVSYREAAIEGAKRGSEFGSSLQLQHSGVVNTTTAASGCVRRLSGWRPLCLAQSGIN